MTFTTQKEYQIRRILGNDVVDTVLKEHSNPEEAWNLLESSMMFFNDENTIKND